MKYTERFLKGRKLEHLVENQTSYTLNNAEMHVFETHQKAESVLLQLDYPVLASMLDGKKVMHLRDLQSFDFFPGESIILPAKEVMCIDFPEANMNNPTRCLAMGISEEKIRKTIQLMNEQMSKADEKEWSFLDYNFHYTNDIAMYQIIKRLLFLFSEEHPSKDLFVDMALHELIIRVLQSASKKNYLNNASVISSNNRLAFIIDYIRKHIDQPLTIEILSQKTYMSASNFHRVFKNELGVSPVDFINEERIRLATSLLHDPKKKIKEVCFECGFNNRSYFTRMFKRIQKCSPREYQLSIQK